MLPAVRTQSRSHRPTVSIVGPGNLGSALAVTLSGAGYVIESIAVRNQNARTRALARRTGARQVRGKQSLSGDVVWITVPDDAITDTARELARTGDWKGKIVFHSSGALTSDELAPLRAKGARVASVHPMMTFARGAAPEMAGVAFALEGDASAVRIAKSIVASLGGKPFLIQKANKVLYHVFGSFASPLLIALIAAMEEVALAAGIRKRDVKSAVAPLLSQTLRNYLRHDAGSVFTGPIVRGDVTTIRKHLAQLEQLPEARAVYVALAKSALKNLPVKSRDQIARALVDRESSER